MVEKINPTPSDEQLTQTMVDGAKIHLHEAGHTPNSALAVAFLNYGRNRLLEADKFIQHPEGMPTAMDPASFIEAIKDTDMKTSALTAIGFILVGSLAFALEAAKKNKFWDNEVYKARYNEAIRNTALPQLKVIANSSADDTRRILTMAEQDRAGDLSLFFRDTTSLPALVQRNLGVYAQLRGREAFGKASLLFTESSRRLKVITSSTFSQIPPEERIAGYQETTLAPSVADFLSDITKDFK